MFWQDINLLNKPDLTNGVITLPYLVLKNQSIYDRDHIFGILLWVLDLQVRGYELEVSELVRKCENPDYQVTKVTQLMLESLEMLDTDGSLPKVLKDIVLSAVNREHPANQLALEIQQRQRILDLRFTSPVLGDTCLKDFAENHLTAVQRAQWRRVLGTRADA